MALDLAILLDHRSIAEDLLDLFVALIKDIAKEPFVVLAMSRCGPADSDLTVRRLDSRTEDGEFLSSGLGNVNQHLARGGLRVLDGFLDVLDGQRPGRRTG